MASGQDLERARADLASAGARLRKLKRVMTQPVEASPRARRWSVVRRMVEALRETMSSWLEAAPLVGDAPPEALSRRAEIEATMTRAQDALVEVERKRRGLEDEQARALAQLEVAADAWALLYRDLPTAAPGLGHAELASLLGRFQRLLVEGERAVDEERQARGDAEAARAAWRWVVDVTYPAFEQRLAAADDTLLLPTLRRLIEELDERWRAELERAAPPRQDRALPAEEADQAQRQAREENLVRDAVFERAAAAWVAQVETLVRAVDQARDQVTTERAQATQRVEAVRRDAEAWRQAQQAAHAELGRCEERLVREKERSAALERVLRFVTARVSRLRDAALAAAAVEDVAGAAQDAAQSSVRDIGRSLEAAADAAAEKLAASAAKAGEELAERLAQQAAALPPPAPAPAPVPATGTAPAPAAPAVPAASDAPAAAPLPPPEEGAELPESAVPSVEPVLDPAWERLLQTMGRPLGAAGAQLRRLYAARMPDPYRAVVRATAGYVAQASDVARVVREYLDETPADDARGRLDAAVDGALAVWEPALARRGIRVTRSIARDLPAVRAKTETLRLAVYQLLRNAWEAMPRGGALTVRVSRDEASGEARALFSDTGPGFSPAAREKAFAPFSSAKPGHIGLGLALGRRIARRAGGELELQAGSPSGAALLLRLPPADEAPSAAPPA